MRTYNQPGPGVRKDEPRKQGAASFVEVLTRNIGDLIKLNILLQLCFLPSQAMLAYAVINGMPKSGLGWLLYTVLSIVSALPAGAAISAASRCICKKLMHDPGYMFHEFKRVYRHSFRQATMPGMAAMLIMNAYCYFLFQLMGGYILPTAIMFIGMLLSMLIFFATMSVFFLQAAFMQLSALSILKNSILIIIGYLPRCLAGAAIYVVLFLIILALFPTAMLFLIFIGYILSMLASLMLIWPPVNNLFNIQESLDKQATSH